jgi:hypothetical protein
MASDRIACNSRRTRDRHRCCRRAAESQLRQDRETAAEQLRQNFELANSQITESRTAATQQLELAQRALTEQLDQARRAQELATEQLEQSRAAANSQLEQDRLAAEQQADQARQAAIDQSRPYVLLTAEISSVSTSMLDLVLSNVGAGPAYDVKIDVDPPLRRATETPGYELANARIFRKPMEMLPPHYRMRMWFESGPDRTRNGIDLPDSHEVTITYHDGHGNRWTERSVLDMTVLDGLLFTDVFGVHHVAKSLREIEKTLRHLQALGGPLQVTVEDRERHIARQKAEYREQVRQHEEIARRLTGGGRGGDDQSDSD